MIIQMSYLFSRYPEHTILVLIFNFPIGLKKPIFPWVVTKKYYDDLSQNPSCVLRGKRMRGNIPQPLLVTKTIPNKRVWTEL